MLKNKKQKLFLGIIIIFLLILLILFLIVLVEKVHRERDSFAPALRKKEIIIDQVIAGREAFLITGRKRSSKYGDNLAVFHKTEEGWKRTYDKNFKDFKPWKIELGDVDGDGVKEIMIAVKKTVHFDPSLKNRLYIFHYTQGKLIKKWTGSEIAGKWIDFFVKDMVPRKGDEVIFIRKSGEGDRISMYYWFDFGFLQLAESKEYKDIREVFLLGQGRIIIAYKASGIKKRTRLKLSDNKLIEE